MEKNNNYSKRPFWHWLMIYLIIGLVIYGIFYFFVFAKKGSGYNYSHPNPQQQNY